METVTDVHTRVSAHILCLGEHAYICGSVDVGVTQCICAHDDLHV